MAHLLLKYQKSYKIYRSRLDLDLSSEDKKRVLFDFKHTQNHGLVRLWQ